MHTIEQFEQNHSGDVTIFAEIPSPNKTVAEMTTDEKRQYIITIARRMTPKQQKILIKILEKIAEK